MKKLLLATAFLLTFVSVASGAEIAIMWNWESDDAMGYKLGDIVAVMPDDTSWGTQVDPRINPNSRFIIVQITGLPVDDFNQYSQALYDWTDPENPVMLRKRQFKFDEGKIPQNILKKIEQQNGFIIVTPEMWNNFIGNKEGTL